MRTKEEIKEKLRYCKASVEGQDPLPLALYENSRVKFIANQSAVQILKWILNED